MMPVIRDPPLIGEAGGRGRLSSSSWEHLARPRRSPFSYLSYGVPRTNYPVDEPAILLHWGKSWERSFRVFRERKVRPRSTARSFARSLPLVSRSRPSAKTFFSADVDDKLSSLELGSGSRYALLKVLSDDCAKKAPLHFLRERIEILCLMCSWIIASM